MKIRFVAKRHRNDFSKRNRSYAVWQDDRKIGVLRAHFNPDQTYRHWIPPTLMMQKYCRIDDDVWPYLNMSLRDAKAFSRQMLLCPDNLSGKTRLQVLNYVREIRKKPQPAGSQWIVFKMKTRREGDRERVCVIFLDGVLIEAANYQNSIREYLIDQPRRPVWQFSSNLKHNLNIPQDLEDDQSDFQLPFLKAKALVRHILKNDIPCKLLQTSDFHQLADFARNQEIEWSQKNSP